MKARCPVCDQLVGITPTGQRQQEGRSSEWQRVDMHAAKGEVCPGSGAKV